MKKLLIIGLCALAMCASFGAGAFWQYRAERQEIAEIEAVALEACNVKVKNIQKMCMKQWERKHETRKN